MPSFGDFRGRSQSLCAHRHPKKQTSHIILFPENSLQTIRPFFEICPFRKGHIKKDIFRPEKDILLCLKSLRPLTGVIFWRLYRSFSEPLRTRAPEKADSTSIHVSRKFAPRNMSFSLNMSFF